MFVFIAFFEGCVHLPISGRPRPARAKEKVVGFRVAVGPSALGAAGAMELSILDYVGLPEGPTSLRTSFKLASF